MDGFLFDVTELEKKPRKKPQKLMHVIDAGPGEGDWCNVEMQCNHCKLVTEWFQVRTVTEAKRGIPCPRCNGIEYKTNDHGEYVVED